MADGGEQKQRSRKSTPPSVYDLRISLKGIRPSIRRTVRVPGNSSLLDVYEIIQTVMPWYDSHLHGFEFAGQRYAPDFPDARHLHDEFNEADHTLESLGIRENQRLYYVYDFGDTWTLVIRVGRIRSAEELSEEDHRLPRCTSGKRAAPPEDCGGVYGYEHVLYLVSADPAELSEEEREMREWVGHWDPEAFDLASVNDELRRRWGAG